MTETKRGISETLEILEFGLSLGDGLAKSLADKEIKVEDLANFLPSILLIPNAFQGINELPAELKDLDAAELDQIKTVVINKLGSIAGIEAKWLTIAQESFAIGLSVSKIIKAIKE